MMDDIKIGEGENGANDNRGTDACICGLGGPHTLECVMHQEGLRTVTIHFDDFTASPAPAPSKD